MHVYNQHNHNEDSHLDSAFSFNPYSKDREFSTDDLAVLFIL